MLFKCTILSDNQKHTVSKLEELVTFTCLPYDTRVVRLFLGIVSSEILSKFYAPLDEGKWICSIIQTIKRESRTVCECVSHVHFVSVFLNDNIISREHNLKSKELFLLLVY